jgi:serine/threonine protein phosphatase PrpC
MIEHSSYLSDVHVITDCGPVREENQDAGVAWKAEDGDVALVVADGMGGHAAGREAAEIVVRSCLEALRKRQSEPWEEVFHRAVAAAQAAVREASVNGDGRASMGATVAVAVVGGLAEGPHLHVAHVGDSRVYLFRGRSLYRLTADHSLVAQMVRDGLLSEEEAFGHPDGNVIQRAIGQSGPLEPEVQEPLPLDAGDVVLLCSDGLHGAVADATIGEILSRSGSAEEICRSLLAAALEAGSEDNITIGCTRLVAQRPGRRDTRVLS